MPPTYLEICELDVLRKEGVEFGERLKAASVETDLVELESLPRAY